MSIIFLLDNGDVVRNGLNRPKDQIVDSLFAHVGH